jgi:hypothetical protein
MGRWEPGRNVRADMGITLNTNQTNYEFIARSPDLGFWDGRNWTGHMKHAKRFDTMDELVQELKTKGYDQNKLAIHKVEK